jgi:uncharacterized protein (DUF1501 family)
MMNRRDFLRTLFATTAGSALFSQSISSALAASAPKSLIVIFQRGGCDGLNVVVPYGEDEYYNLRPSIAIPPPGQTGGALDMDTFFGLHPSMSSLHTLYNQNQVAVFPAVHYPNASRSHFDSQTYMESARTGAGNDINRFEVSGNVEGWLNRHLATSANSTGMRGVSFGSSVADSLLGPVSVSSFNDLRNFDLDLEAGAEQRLSNRLNTIYNQGASSSRHYDDLLRSSGQTLFRDLDIVRSIDASNYQPANGANYPDNSYGRQLAQAAQLIKAGTGLELATINLGGWDTHKNQGGAEGGMADRLRNFSDGIAAFYADMGTQQMSNVMILTMTEFGRTSKENGSGGTDHGHASSWFALGGGLTGGVYGTWHGLAEEQRERGRYLAQGVDYRDIFDEILQRHLNNTNNSIIPDYTASHLGFLT